jgi:hypothetical protein
MRGLRRNGRLSLVLLVVVAVQTSPALAWGNRGHRAVGRIAERYLTPEAAREVAALLAPEKLTFVPTWADEIRSDPAWVKGEPWHWVTIPMGTTYADSKKNPAGDVLEAIARFERILADRAAPRVERQQALKWLAHLVGDLHQPMHVGTRDDRGGNEVMVLWFGEPSNLHAVWDSGLIDRSELSFTELADKADTVSAAQAKEWQSTSPLVWADESRTLGERAYVLGDRRLSFRYSFDHWPTVELRIQQAGVRLAALLNGALGPQRDQAGDWLPVAVAVPAR